AEDLSKGARLAAKNAYTSRAWQDDLLDKPSVSHRLTGPQVRVKLREPSDSRLRTAHPTARSAEEELPPGRSHAVANGREGAGSNRSPPQSLLVIEKDGGVLGRNGRRRTRAQKAAQDRDRDNQLAHSCHLLSRSNCSGSARRGHTPLRPWPERLGLRTGRIGRCVRTRRVARTGRGDACLATRSSRLVPNSSSLLTQRHRRRSTGPANTLRTGAADETLRMAKGMLHVSRARCRRRAASRAPRRRTSLRRGTLAGRARRGDDALGMGRRLP